ncbi:MAG: hypothetical protein A3K19_32650 [Lentisphaerae bacterium RIFOXYB12_FULL_65_16]|nr:MAG: hypothetical protein A3K18_07915 [Lentisphaerae bacterium RIFOXYA12_64_32]OGV84446.1 MAG: hypothetical protein A3K19_32650 [Lentisphaerae bacterium RIFOXYB12_FULL_65_16]
MRLELGLGCRLAGMAALLFATGNQIARGAAESAVAPESPADYYVATNGSDAWSGVLAEPNATKTDGPFATLERARDEIRKRKAAGALPAGGLTVGIRGGIYELQRTIELAAQDSGTPDAPIVYRASGKDAVRFVGGKTITGWTPVTDPAVLERLDPVARGKVLQADLKAAGASDLGSVAAVGGKARAELVCNGQYMTLARYPNTGDFMRIADVPQTGEKPYEHEKLVHYGRFTYDGDRPAQWKDTSDVWVHGYWVHDWSDQYHRIQKLDLEKKEIWPEPPYHGYGYKKGQRFYVLNVLEELDQPGEWYLDRKTGVLYFWMPCETAKAEVFFPEFQKPMLVLENTQHVTVRGITFECSRAGAVVVKGGTHNEIAGCTVRNVGNTAIDIQGGTQNGVRSCDVYEVASTGIGLAGGDRKTLTPAGNYVENCQIHHFARILKTYKPAVQLNGVGNRISHCYIHDGPHEGIGYGGNDHVIEYTEFTRIALETGDVGVTYTMGDWTILGHEFRYNYFHHIHGPGNLGCFVIYPDLPCGGIHLYGNVFYDVDQVFHTNSGRGMLVENNVFMKCGGLSFSAWGDPKKFEMGGDWHMVENLKAVNYDQPPYSTRYPMLQRLAEDFKSDADDLLQRRLPKDNILRRNVSSGEFFLRLDPKATLDDCKVENNVIAADVVFQGSFDGNGKSVAYRNGDEAVAAEFAKRGNIIVKGDPGFGDMQAQDFSLGADSPAAKIGFERIPFEQIGLVKDEYRTALPLTVYAPTLSPASRTFLQPLTVRLTPTPLPRGSKSVIRYTLDGSEPSDKSPAYTGPLNVTNTVTLKAAAFVTDGETVTRSETVTATYTATGLGKGGLFLSDLDEQDLAAYLPCWKKDTNYAGKPIRLGGVGHAKGILLHPEDSKDGNRACVTYLLDGELRNAKRFTAVIGIDDAMAEAYKKGSATFAVELFRAGKWERAFESGVLKYSDKPQDVSIDITGAEKLRLVTTDGGDGIACDHAEWANPKLR